MLRFKMRGIAIDPSGNEREVLVEMVVTSQTSSSGDSVTCTIGEDGDGEFTVKAEPGKFNPWGPLDDRAKAKSDG